MKGFVKTNCILLLMGLALLGYGTSAWASVIFNLQGLTDPNNRARVSFAVDTTGITIDITNTSVLPAEPCPEGSPSYDPRITAFAFNVPETVTGVSSFSGPDGWSPLFDPDSIETPEQLGRFDLAGITGPNFNGGFSNDGIPIGATYSFLYELAGTFTPNEAAFLDLLSSPGSSGNDALQSFVARFQRTGCNGNGSDVAVVPIPATLLLFGSGMLSLLGIRRKFKN